MANFTEREIKRSFIKLLNEKPLSKISVRDIVEDCGINRNSFYYHFQDIPALLEQIVTEQATAIIRKYPQPDSLEECFRAAFEFALSNRRAAYNVFNSVNRDLLDRELLRLCDSMISAYMTKNHPEAAIPGSAAGAVQCFIKCELFGLTIDWMNNGMKDDSITELLRFAEFCKALPSLINSKKGDSKN